MNMNTEIATGYCDIIHSRYASEGGGKSSRQQGLSMFRFIDVNNDFNDYVF